MARSLTVILLVFTAFALHAQYLESFTGQNGKGLVNAICPAGTTDISNCGSICNIQATDNTNTCTTVPITFSSWYIQRAPSTPYFTTPAGLGFEFDSPDDFGIISDRLQVEDTDHEFCWYSPVLTISASGMVSISVDVSQSGGLEAADFAKGEYSVNGSPYVQFGTVSGAFTPTQFTVSGLLGSTLQIRLCAKTDEAGENIFIDNISVPQNSVTVMCTPVAFTVTGTTAFCANGLGTPVGLNGSQPGFSYQLFLGSNPVGFPVAGTGNPITFGNQLTAGTYTVVATNSASTGCTATMTGSAVLTPDISPSFSATAIRPTSCSSNNGSITLTIFGGVTPLTYNWYTADGCGIVPGQQNQTALCAGFYSLVVTGNNGCTATGFFDLTVPGGCNGCSTLGSVTVVPNPICAGQTTTMSVSGGWPGASYTWYDMQTGGTQVGTGNPFTTGSLMAATTYCVEQTVRIPTQTTFNFTGAVQTFVVPPGVTSLNIQAYGAEGAHADLIAFSGGTGGYAVGNLAVTPGQTLQVYVGGQNGFNGGGLGGFSTNQVFGGNGGGASDVRTGAGTLTDRVIVAGGGGGGGSRGGGSAGLFGGGGGGYTGITGGMGFGSFDGQGGGGGTQNAGGPGGTASLGTTGSPGTLGVGGNGAVPNPQGLGPGGGGGGGYYGGGGAGSSGLSGSPGGGGGGGSSYIGGVFNASTSVNGTGFGNGKVVFSYALPCTSNRVCGTVTVNPTPDATATPASQTTCSGTAITTIALSSHVANTSFNWTRNNMAAITGISNSGSGNISGILTNTTQAPVLVTFTITPSTPNCVGSDITATVLVNPTPTTFPMTGGGLICTTDNVGLPVGLANSQLNVNYQLRLNGNNTGAPISGTGAAISFGPQLAGVYTIVATHTQGGCTATMNGSATVATFNCTVNNFDPCICLNNATTLTNGQFGEVIRINAPTGQIWTVTAVTGLYTNFSPAPPAAPVPLTVGATFTETPAGSGIYLLSGRHIEAVGYTLSAGNAAGTILTIGNTCAYPNPVITADLSGPFCLYSDPVALTGNPNDALLAAVTPNPFFSITPPGGSATPSNTFDPGAGLGQYLITYTVNGGVAKAGGPTDPGCIQSVSQTVQVVATPSNLICNNLSTVSLDESCSLELNPDDILEGSYACYDDYVVEIDRTLPLGNGPWQPGMLGPGDVGQTYAVQVTHLGSNNKCWGNIAIEDKLPPVFDHCGCTPTPLSQFAGSIDVEDPEFVRPLPGTACGTSFNSTFYDTYTFEVQTAGVYTFAQFADGGDGFGVLYAGSFDPMNPCLNFVESDDDDNVPPPVNQGDDFLLNTMLTPGTYVLVVTTFGGNVAYSAYTVSVSGPAPVTAGDNCTFNCGDKDGLLSGEIFVQAPVANDNCSTVSLTKTDVYQDGGACDNSFIFRTWTATDAWGNSSQCTQTLTLTPYTLDDVTRPEDRTIACAGCGQYDSPLPCETGIPTVPGHDADGMYELIRYDENCQVITEGLCNLGAQYEDTRINVCPGTFKILRHWTVLDWCTNTSVEFDQLIKVVDEVGPVILGPADMTVSTNPSQCCANVNLPDVIVEDACSATGNVSAMITVYDQFLPDQVIGTFTVNGNFLSTFPGNNFWDCDTLGNFGITPCVPIGTHQVIYIAQDICGNTSVYTFNLTVVDDVAPVATCTQFTTVAIGPDDPTDCYEPAGDCEFAGVTWVPASAFNQGSQDNCSGIDFTIRRMEDPLNGYSDCIDDLQGLCDGYEYTVATQENDSIKFYCCEVGTTQTLILRVYQTDLNGGWDYFRNDDRTPLLDPDGNIQYIFNECMIQVEVQDKIKPVCQAPANVTVSCENFDPSLWAYDYPFVTDNCCLDQTPPTSADPQGQTGIPTGTTAIPEICGATQKTYYNNFLNANFDTTCNRGIIIRRFTAWDCQGQSSSCTQRITVENTQDYRVRFPADVSVNCATEPNFGAPVITNDEGCELIGVSYNDVVFTVVPDACYKIERTWRIINWCTYNPDQPCYAVPRNAVNPTTGLAPFKDWRIFTDAIADDNCVTYKQVVKVIDQTPPTVACQDIDTCDYSTNNPRYWNDGDNWWDNGTMQHDLCEMETEIAVTADDFCDTLTPTGGLRFRYLLFLDLDGDGIMETVVSSADAATRPVGQVLFNNYQSVNYATGTNRLFDNITNQNQRYRFDIEQTANGARVIWRNASGVKNPELAHGRHKIKWIVEDGCGNEAVCEKAFEIRDCKPPVVACADVNISLMVGGTAILWATDFFLYGEDNCTPTNILNPTLAVIRADENPNNIYPANQPQSVIVTCADFATGQPVAVQVWLIDAAGNAEFCLAYVIPQSNLAGCETDALATVAGALETENIQGIEDATVELAVMSPTGQQGVLTAFSNASGDFQFPDAVQISGSYTLTPTKDDNPLNGVTTYDLVLISKHILGLEILNSPYKMIAADANRSGSITTFDIVEFRKLILGIYNHLPNNTSWRFVDRDHVFPLPSNPFIASFPENISVQNVQEDHLEDDFVGIKIGDVNNTVIANSLLSLDERTSATLLFDVQDRDVKSGEVFTLHFKGAEQVQGYQFTMNLAGLEVLDIQPGAKMTMQNFAVFEGALTTSVDGDDNEFAITFRATKPGRVSRMLSVSSRITKAEAYGTDNERLDVAFRFRSPAGTTTVGVGFEVYQNQPNPFVNKTVIGFHLPEAAEATLKVYDETGRIVFTQSGTFARGYNTFPIERQLTTTTGVLYYTVETATDSATRKMIRSK